MCIHTIQDAKLLFDNGVNSVKENLYKYDAGGGQSYYDIYQRPASKYHEYHIETLDMLYKITGDTLLEVCMTNTSCIESLFFLPYFRWSLRE